MSRDNELFAATTNNSINSVFIINQLDKFANNPQRQSDAVVVLDNAKVHHSLAFKAKIDEWSQQGVTLFYNI